MAVDVIMPQMGESIFEGTITRWLKKPGDRVERDEPLFEISTDKVDAEIPAPSAGVLKEIKVTEGQTVPIQTVVAVIDAAGAAAAAPAAAPAPSPAPEKAAPPKAAAPPPAPAAPAAPAPPAPAAASVPAAAPRRPPKCGRQWPKNSQFAARPQARERTQRGPRRRGGQRGGRTHQQERYSRRGRVRRREGLRPRGAPAPAAATPSAAPAAAAAGRRRHRASGAGKRRPARADLFRQLRSPAHERDAPAHCRAHGGLQARFAARLLHRRSGHDADRQNPRAFESRVRSQVRDEADIHALLRARLRRGACAPFRRSTRRPTGRRSCCTAKSTWASPWRSTGA